MLSGTWPSFYPCFSESKVEGALLNREELLQEGSGVVLLIENLQLGVNPVIY